MVNYSGYGLELDTESWRWSWTLSGEGSVLFHCMVCLFYIVSVFALQGWVASKSKSEMVAIRTSWRMDSVKWLHNVALSVISLAMCVAMVYSTWLDGRFESWHTMSCMNTDNSGLYGFANWVYLVSKLWEWIDTYWLVLYEKPVIVLHAFHHMTTFTMAALTHNFPVGGYAFINCLVHFVMYLHYSHPVRWARPFITSGQLIQFVVVISIHTSAFLSEDGGKCFDFSAVKSEWWYCQLVVVGYFLLFVKFFIDNYGGPKKAKAKKA